MDSKNINNHTPQLLARRKFISTGLQAAGVAAILTVPGSGMAGELFHSKGEYTVQEVIDIILKEIPGAPVKDTVDTIKTGNAGQKVTGIVTTMFPTIAVIKEAIRIHANFIIAHEPSFYNHLDNKNWIENNDVLNRKLQLLAENNITIWRAHDCWHAHQPDGIATGVVKKAGWENYYKAGGKILTIPAITLKELVKHLKTKLNIGHVRIIGDLSQSCTKIALLPGSWGGKNQITTVVQDKPDVLIVGEVDEWETSEYIRDATMLGINVSLIILGHSVSEEPGMEWMAEWLQPKVPGVTITHIASNDPFTWV
jgi:putative NIF3 family GTP cyclohydrolase 1 type 2